MKQIDLHQYLFKIRLSKEYYPKNIILLIKANDTNPDTHAWYLYNLKSLGWNGTDTIDISGLWLQRGSFLHGDIYGTPQAAIPEPATMLLLGIGLIGLAGFRKRIHK